MSQDPGGEFLEREVAKRTINAATTENLQAAITLPNTQSGTAEIIRQIFEGKAKDDGLLASDYVPLVKRGGETAILVFDPVLRLVQEELRGIGKA